MRTISICIPTWNRCEMTLNAFNEVYSDKRINEIVIVDDCSDIEIYEELKSICDLLPKVKLHRNEVNLDCYKNKKQAITYAKNEYVLIIDSDNQVNTSFIDKIFEQEWSEDTILAPSYAMPTFDYRPYSGITLTRNNIAQYIDKPMLQTLLNTANYFVNKNTYLECFDETIDPVTSDSIFMNYNLLQEGNKIKVVEGLEYLHLVHSGSHYVNNVKRTPENFNEILLDKLRNLS